MWQTSKLFVCLFALSLVGSGIAPANPYYVTALSPIGSDTASAGMSVAVVGGAPEVAGWCGPTTSNCVPVAWIGSTPTNLLPLIPGASAGSNTSDSANAIDTNGDIVGTTIVGGNMSAFYLPSGGGTATVLPFLDPANPGASAAGLNNSGTVVGYSYNSTYTNPSTGNPAPCPNAFVWTAGGGIIDLGASGVPSYATAVSANGNTVIGETGLAPPGLGQACEWTRSGSTWTMTPLVPLSLYAQSTALGINSSGDIVGAAFDYPEGGVPNPETIAMEIKPNGSVVDLGALSGGITQASAINDSGVIAGYSGTGSNGGGFVNYSGLPGANVRLLTLLSPVSGAGWTALNYAYGIDDNGDIVGRGKGPAPGGQAYLLTPAQPGDANLDGQVDINDLTVVLANYNQTGMTWSQGEFTGAGTVDINDLTIVLANYNKTFGASAGPTAAVPEPSALLSAAGGLLGLLVCARRKRTEVPRK